MQSYFEMMETHGWNLEDSNKVVWTSDNRRTYDCTFCKQGFSNAQALGGHMNIHRRERLKLKQLEDDDDDDDNLSSDTTNKNPFYTPSPTNFPSPLSEFGDERSYIKSSWIHRGEDGPTVDATHRRDLQQLLLLDDARLHNEDRRSVGYGLHQGSTTQLSHGLDRTEVDLELRLGREPPPPMSMALKEFL